jgi:hypothetical protein
VVLLSTNEKVNVLKGYKNRSLLFNFKSSYHNEGELIERELAYFHLYITSDEEIKEGDWVIQFDSNNKSYRMKYFYSKIVKFEPRKYINYGKGSYIFKKIIATTDTSLGIEEAINKANSSPCEVGSTGWISIKQANLLPQPSPQFISKYIEQYNKGNIITNVLVEYEEFHGLNTSLTEISSFNNNPVDYGKDYRIKVDSHNQITIKPVQPKLYTEEEVKQIAWKAYTHTYPKMSPSYIADNVIPEFNNWFEENL